MKIYASILLMLLSTVSLFSQLREDTVYYRCGDTNLKGYVFYNSAKPGKMPALLIIHEWWGVNEYAITRAKQFGSIGFVAFAVDMYGDGFTTDDAKEAQRLSGSLKKNIPLLRERINAALQYVRSLENVDTAKIAAIGYCFGGTTALELARSGADIKGVVCYHGGLSTPNPEETKNVKAKVLVFHGAADKFVPEEEVMAFRKEFDSAGVDWQLHLFSGAVHSFSNPKSGNQPETGVAYNESADRRAAKAVISFLVEVLK